MVRKFLPEPFIFCSVLCLVVDAESLYSLHTVRYITSEELSRRGIKEVVEVSRDSRHVLNCRIFCGRRVQIGYLLFKLKPLCCYAG
jgi:hypothetical protein